MRGSDERRRARVRLRWSNKGATIKASDAARQRGGRGLDAYMAGCMPGQADHRAHTAVASSARLGREARCCFARTTAAASAAPVAADGSSSARRRAARSLQPAGAARRCLGLLRLRYLTEVRDTQHPLSVREEGLGRPIQQVRSHTQSCTGPLPL